MLVLGFWSKFLFMFLYTATPRLLLGLIGYNYLSNENHIAMIVFCFLGFILDMVTKHESQRTRGSNTT